MEIEYAWLPGKLAQQPFLEECSQLFSTHYGFWSRNDPLGRGGQAVKFSQGRIRQLLASPDSIITYARCQGLLIGYATAVQTKVKHYGLVSWVTQLVVHGDYRRAGVGKTLLYSIWQFSDHFAWGLTSANPFAIRALEKATRRRCDPRRIRKNAKKLLNLGLAHVPYIREDTKALISEEESCINTEFFVDHSRLTAMLAEATASIPWQMGSLNEGWEWFAFAFHDQNQLSISPEEICSMLDASDDITRQAYGRMTYSEEHKWAQHTESETSFIIEQCKLQPGQSVLDLGCGAGRHSLALSKRELQVTGVDFVETLIIQAKSKAQAEDAQGVDFINADCRSVQLGKMFNAAICLYDVVGSFADDEDNSQLLDSMFIHLVPGGFGLLSVMNYGLTKRRAKNYFSLAAEPDKLLTLPASKIMETTGDVFDPQFFMIDKDTRIVYRKEQFVRGHELPLELIIRDRRFDKEEIEEHCRAVGFDVLWSRFVRAGRWAVPLDEDDDHAKEILVLCRRPN